MSSLATPWLDLTVACQRHTLKRTTYLTARPPFDPSRFGVEPIDTADARTFVETHHYSGTFPVEIASYGLSESRPNARAALVGVAVFSIPVNTPAALTALLEPGQTVCDLGRFVLNDHVLANAETWFLTRAYRALRKDKMLADGRTPRFPFSTSYSDPCPRPSFDQIIFPGHVGIVYQAKNACYTGRSRARSLCLTRSGRPFGPGAVKASRRRQRRTPPLKAGIRSPLSRARADRGAVPTNPPSRQSPLCALALEPAPASQDPRRLSHPPLPQAHRPSSRRRRAPRGYEFGERGGRDESRGMSSEALPRRLLVLACSATKRHDIDRIPGRDRYDGPLWRTLRTTDPDDRLARVAFLSAHFGFREARTEIEDYDARLTRDLAERMIAGGVTTRWPRPRSPRRPDNCGMHPGAEIAQLTRYAKEPMEDVALVGGHLYLDVMRALLVGFREMHAIEPDARVVEINGPIGLMRRNLRAWLLGERGQAQ